MQGPPGAPRLPYSSRLLMPHIQCDTEKYNPFQQVYRIQAWFTRPQKQYYWIGNERLELDEKSGCILENERKWLTARWRESGLRNVQSVDNKKSENEDLHCETIDSLTMGSFLSNIASGSRTHWIWKDLQWTFSIIPEAAWIGWHQLNFGWKGGGSRCRNRKWYSEEGDVDAEKPDAGSAPWDWEYRRSSPWTIIAGWMGPD